VCVCVCVCVCKNVHDKAINIDQLNNSLHILQWQIPLMIWVDFSNCVQIKKRPNKSLQSKVKDLNTNYEHESCN